MEMYRVTQIEGKGLGVVATKFIKRGTLILKENPQMPRLKTPPLETINLQTMQIPPDPWKDYFKTVMSLFDQMSESDQEEYLKLHINHEKAEVKIIGLLVKLSHFKMVERDQDKILKIVGIHLTNTFADGVKIKTSRFNHSCFPNAVLLEKVKLRATYDIKEGQEITINYRGGFMTMRKREYRQKILNDCWNFTCSCDLCKKQDHRLTGVSQTEIETKIEELIEEVEKFKVDRVTAATKSLTPMMASLQYSPEKGRREIDCYKKLYQFGKEKKAHRYCLYHILSQACEMAAANYLICLDLKKTEFLEEFKKECINFAKTAEGFSKLLGEELVEPELWKKRHQNFEKTLMEELQK